MPTIDGTILVLDDEISVCRSIHAILSSRNVLCEVFCEVREFMQALEAVPDVHAILLDMYLARGMTGIDVLRDIRNSGIAVPAVLMSGMPLEFESDELMPIEVVDKPFDVEKLLQSLHKFL